MDSIVYTPEQVSKSISALQDSLNLITLEITKNNDTEESKDLIRRNYQHIEIMLDKEFIKSSGQDLDQFRNAIATAKTYLGE